MRLLAQSVLCGTGYRLYIAYRMYLRFPHPLTVVLSSQIIALLVAAVLIVNTIRF